MRTHAEIWAERESMHLLLRTGLRRLPCKMLGVKISLTSHRCIINAYTI